MSDGERERVERLKTGEPIDIVFDGPPGPVCGRFVEVEAQDGRSISVGEWVHRDDGYWVLRINLPEAARAEGKAEGRREMWEKCMAVFDGVRTEPILARMIRALDGEETQASTTSLVRTSEDGTVIPKRPCCKVYLDEPHLNGCPRQGLDGEESDGR